MVDQIKLANILKTRVKNLDKDLTGYHFESLVMNQIARPELVAGFLFEMAIFAADLKLVP